MQLSDMEFNIVFCIDKSVIHDKFWGWSNSFASEKNSVMLGNTTYLIIAWMEINMFSTVFNNLWH